MRVGRMVILLAVFVFCLWGFMATFGEMDETQRFIMRSIYGSAGLVCLLMIAWQLRPQKPEEPEKKE